MFFISGSFSFTSITSGFSKLNLNLDRNINVHLDFCKVASFDNLLLKVLCKSSECLIRLHGTGLARSTLCFSPWHHFTLSQLHCHGRTLHLPDNAAMLTISYATLSRLRHRGCTSGQKQHYATMFCLSTLLMRHVHNKHGLLFLHIFRNCLLLLFKWSAPCTVRSVYTLPQSKRSMSARQLFLSRSPETAYGTARMHGIFSFNNSAFFPTAFYMHMSQTEWQTQKV